MRILIATNSSSGLYKFRAELIKKFISCNNEVDIITNYSGYQDELKRLGANLIKCHVDRRGINPFADIKILCLYINHIKKIKPDIILTYTIKPNIYCGIAAEICDINYIANITGLGSAVKNGGLLEKFLIAMYKIAFQKISCVFFQNKENESFFSKNNIANERHRLIPGSGVNLKQFNTLDYPSDETVEFVFIARIMKEKGIDQYLECAEYIREKYPNTRFHICGSCEEAYQERLDKLNAAGTIIYHGLVSNVREILQITHCTIHPSYHEGMSNVLLESSASGRPCLCSNIPGCKEIVDDGETGFLFNPQDTESLISAVEKFIELPHDLKKQFGINARRKVEREFDRQIVIDAYMDEIGKINKGGIN